MAEKAVVTWNFARDDGRLDYGDDRLIVEGKTLTVPFNGPDGQPLECGHWGLHGSPHILDALDYAGGCYLHRREHFGQIDMRSDRLCSTGVRVVKVYPLEAVKRMLHEFDVWCAVAASFRYSDIDARYVWAVAVKLRWLEGLASDDQLRLANGSLPCLELDDEEWHLVDAELLRRVRELKR